MKNVWNSVLVYLVILTLGTIGGLLFWFFQLLGLIRVEGYWKLWREVYEGNHIIAANHPTLLETAIIPMMFWPFAIVMPNRFFLWSVPDGALFPKWLNWLYDAGHCIKVMRVKTKNPNEIKIANRKAVKEIVRVLQSPATVTMHPEGGRTSSEFKGDKIPEKRYGECSKTGIKIRRITTGVPEVALLAKARISPVWIDIPFSSEQNGFREAFWTWIRRWDTVTLKVRDSYIPNRELSPYDRNKELASRLLGA